MGALNSRHVSKALIAGLLPCPGMTWKIPLNRISTLLKKIIVFPVPSRGVTNQTLSGRELLNYSRPGRVWLVTSRLGTGKTIIFFTVHDAGVDSTEKSLVSEDDRTIVGHFFQRTGTLICYIRISCNLNSDVL
jgi:hypothetical protein